MSFTTAASAEGVLPHLSPFETAFVRTVLDHRGVGARPSLADFMAAFDLLRRYSQQCLDNPRDGDSWEPALNEERLTEMRAKAFIMFGATKPTPAQWHKVHAALYGALAPDVSNEGRWAGAAR